MLNPTIRIRSNCEPGTIRESSVGSDGKHCCGGEWPKRFISFPLKSCASQDAAASSYCVGCPLGDTSGAIPETDAKTRRQVLPEREVRHERNVRFDLNVKNRQKAAFLLQREAGRAELLLGIGL